jgi:hypothetical protein
MFTFLIEHSLTFHILVYNICYDIFMTLIFYAPKQVKFFTCLLKAILNGCINHYKKQIKIIYVNYFIILLVNYFIS